MVCSQAVQHRRYGRTGCEARASDATMMLCRYKGAKSISASYGSYASGWRTLLPGMGMGSDQYSMDRVVTKYMQFLTVIT